MKMSRQRAIVLALCLAGWPGAGLAADSSLVVVMGGEAYDGPPKFEIDFDGKPVGEGTVAAAIDTAKAGRFAAATDKARYVQSFTFVVPDALFRPEGEISIKFLNEAYGGDGSNRDRTLYLASVTLNGRAVTVSGLTTETASGVVKNEVLGEFLIIPDGNHVAVSKPPRGGWPGATIASAGPVDPATTSTAAPIPAPVEPVATAQAEFKPASLESPPAGTACDLDQKYNVIGFNENSNELTARLAERLDQVAADIGDRQCNVTVTGYSSKVGPIASNALFAIERAQNALRYLEDHGVKYVKASATGVGATDEFGPDPASNRRVVITVSP